MTAIPAPRPTPIPIDACFPNPVETSLAVVFWFDWGSDEMEGVLEEGTDDITVEAGVAVDADAVGFPLSWFTGFDGFELELETRSRTFATDVDEITDASDSEVTAVVAVLGVSPSGS
jgi:hypothetical protein